MSSNCRSRSAPVRESSMALLQGVASRPGSLGHSGGTGGEKGRGMDGMSGQWGGDGEYAKERRRRRRKEGNNKWERGGRWRVSGK